MTTLEKQEKQNVHQTSVSIHTCMICEKQNMPMAKATLLILWAKSCVFQHSYFAVWIFDELYEMSSLWYTEICKLYVVHQDINKNKTKKAL